MSVVAQRRCLHLPYSIRGSTGGFGATVIDIPAAAFAALHSRGARRSRRMIRSTRTPAPPPLASIAPGTVLKTRSVAYHIFGVPTPLKTTQLLYRSTSQTGNPTVNVTSVIQPPRRATRRRWSRISPPTTRSTATTNRRMRFRADSRSAGLSPTSSWRSSARSSPRGTRSSCPTPRVSGRTSPPAPNTE